MQFTKVTPGTSGNREGGGENQRWGSLQNEKTSRKAKDGGREKSRDSTVYAPNRAFVEDRGQQKFVAPNWHLSDQKKLSRKKKEK